MNILIFGQGVVGDATGYALEQRGHTAWFHDPPKGIDGSGHIGETDCMLLCVPTPPAMPEDWCNLAFLNNAANDLLAWEYCGPVGIRSTVPPGTCNTFQEHFPAIQWFSWPEFLRADNARECAVNPERAVMGVHRTRHGHRGWAERDYIFPQAGGLLPTNCEHYHFCRPTEAEFIKYATNAIHAVNVGLANELAELATHYGLDWNALLPPLAPGSEYIPNNIRVTEEGGYGGACLPKDVAALLHEARVNGVALPVLAATHEANVARRPDEY